MPGSSWLELMTNLNKELDSKVEYLDGSSDVYDETVGWFLTLDIFATLGVQCSQQWESDFFFS